jgi:hypothetical protein
VKPLCPEHVESQSCGADELAQRRGVAAALGELGSGGGKQAEPRGLGPARAHLRGTVVASSWGRRQDTAFLQRQGWREPFGLTRVSPAGWGA